MDIRDFFPPPPWEGPPFPRIFLREPFGLPPVELDTEIAPLVYELSKRGYQTISSCAGHYGHRSYGRGAIYFERETSWSDLEEIKQMAIEYGLTGVEIRHARAFPYYYPDISFDPIGKPFPLSE